jgi:pimeloyl-ACP methyl ester carboxylesterase
MPSPSSPKILTLSGWLQAAESLDGILGGSQPFRYDGFATAGAAIAALAQEQPDIVIGWSLGGVLAVQALAHAEYKPKKLILIGAAYQFLASGDEGDGVTATAYHQLAQDYQSNPTVFMRRMQAMLQYGAATHILCPLAEDAANPSHWLPWLEHLAHSSFATFTPRHQPDVLVIHGMKDIIIPPLQAKYWHRLFPKAKVLMLPEISHAPHHQAPELIRRVIADFMGE